MEILLPGLPLFQAFPVPACCPSVSFYFPASAALFFCSDSRLPLRNLHPRLIQPVPHSKIIRLTKMSKPVLLSILSFCYVSGMILTFSLPVLTHSSYVTFLTVFLNNNSKVMQIPDNLFPGYLPLLLFIN